MDFITWSWLFFSIISTQYLFFADLNNFEKQIVFNFFFLTVYFLLKKFRQSVAQTKNSVIFFQFANSFLVFMILKLFDLNRLHKACFSDVKCDSFTSKESVAINNMLRKTHHVWQ